MFALKTIIAAAGLFLSKLLFTYLTACIRF